MTIETISFWILMAGAVATAFVVLWWLWQKGRKWLGKKNTSDPPDSSSKITPTAKSPFRRWLVAGVMIVLVCGLTFGWSHLSTLTTLLVVLSAVGYRGYKHIEVTDDPQTIIRPGVALNPITAHLAFAVCVMGIAVVIAGIFVLLIAPLNRAVFHQPLVYWSLLSGLVLLVNFGAWSSTEERNVSNNHVLPLKVLGMLINVYLTNGQYFIPFYPLLASNRDNVTGDVVIGSEEGSSTNPGQVYVGTVTVHLGEEGKDGNGLMEAAAADNAVVKLRPTHNWRCNSPLQRFGRNRPIKDLNAAARNTHRRAIAETTTGDQANGLPDVLPGLVVGKHFYAVRTRESDATSGVHGGNLVAHKATGKIIFRLKPEDSEEWENEVRSEVEQNGHEKMLEKARDAKTGDIAVFKVFVADGLRRALDENGYEQVGEPRIGELQVPKRVSEAAERAAAEVPERAAALAQAETSRLAGNQLLSKDGGGLSPQDAAMAGLAIENPASIRIVHIPGIGQGGSGANVIINPS